jgi:site-specific recombinase XerD
MPTWSEAIKSHREKLIEDEKSQHTRRNYGEDLALFAAWHKDYYGEDPDPAQLVGTELREWKGSLLDRGLKPATVNRKLAAIRSFARFLEAEGLARPVKSPRCVRQEKPAPHWLARQEQLALVRAADKSGKPRDAAVVQLLLHTGLRADELASLTWGAIELHPRSGKMTVVGKGRKWREIPLNYAAREALASLRKDGDPDPGDRLIHGQRGPVNAWTVHAIVTRMGDAAKLADLTPHVLRHTFCRRLAESGTRLEQIAALAGHESLDTTRRYVEPGRQELAAAVDRLAGGED